MRNDLLLGRRSLLAGMGFVTIWRLVEAIAAASPAWASGMPDTAV